MYVHLSWLQTATIFFSCSVSIMYPLYTSVHCPRRAASHNLTFCWHTDVCVKRVWNILSTCHHTFIGACVPCTCPVFCWRIHDWLAVGVKCRRAERLGGPVLLFAVALHLGGACRLQTHLQVGSLRHALQEREMNQVREGQGWVKERRNIAAKLKPSRNV